MQIAIHKFHKVIAGKSFENRLVLVEGPFTCGKPLHSKAR